MPVTSMEITQEEYSKYGDADRPVGSVSPEEHGTSATLKVLEMAVVISCIAWRFVYTMKNAPLKSGYAKTGGVCGWKSENRCSFLSKGDSGFAGLYTSAPKAKLQSVGAALSIIDYRK